MAETRGAAIMEAVEEIQADLLPGDEADLIVCAGPPRCMLQGNAALDASKNGCPHCTRLTVGEEWPRA